MTVYRGRVTLTPPGSPAGSAVAAAVEPGDAALSIVPEGGAPIELAYSDIDDLFDDDYTLRLTDHTGRRYDLSMLGKAYGQVAAEVAKRRREQLQRDLLLTGVGKPEPFPASVFDGQTPEPAELRLFDDLLVVMPERGLMWGLPYSFIERVEWDEERYQVRVTDDEGTVHAFGWLKKRSEEFRDDLQAKLDALARRTARTLAALVPGLDPGTHSRLSALMRDGRAVQQRAVDAIDPGVWPRLEEAVVGSGDRRESYEALKTMTPPGWAAVGVKATASEGEDEGERPDVSFAEAGERSGATSRETRSEYRERIEDVRTRLASGLPFGMQPARTSDEAASGGRDAAAAPEAAPAATEAAADATATDQRNRLWYFCPLSRDGHPVNAVAQEVTSEESHATYVFRLMDPARFSGLRGVDLEAAVAAAISRLNRALLTLNFRREPIYAPQDQIEGGRLTRYRVALRKLDYLRWTREAFLGRALHTDPAAWRSQIDDAMRRA